MRCTRTVVLLLAFQIVLPVSRLRSCEDEHPPVTLTPQERFVLSTESDQPVMELTFDPRGLSGLSMLGATPDVWMSPEVGEAWHYREWQWWKGHPWGDSCRPRYWTKAPFHVHRGDMPAATIEWRIDGFDTYQQFLLPVVGDPEAPFWDLIVTIQNVSGEDVEEYGQFFACYTRLNRDRSFWFWDSSDRFVLFADRGVGHLDGYVVHPDAYFLERRAIPHCPRGGGKIVGTWGHPVIISHASSGGWRSVILLEPARTASLAHGIRGGAMDYILFPGPGQRTFAKDEQFSVHIRHLMLRSPELPSVARLATLWQAFEASHESVHAQAKSLRRK